MDNNADILLQYANSMNTYGIFSAQANKILYNVHTNDQVLYKILISARNLKLSLLEIKNFAISLDSCVALFRLNDIPHIMFYGKFPEQKSELDIKNYLRMSNINDLKTPIEQTKSFIDLEKIFYDIIDCKELVFLFAVLNDENILKNETIAAALEELSDFLHPEFNHILKYVTEKFVKEFSKNDIFYKWINCFQPENELQEKSLNYLKEIKN